MNNLSASVVTCSFALTSWLAATDAASPPPPAEQAISTQAATTTDTALAARRAEQEELSADNKLEAERLIQTTNSIRAEVTRIKLERELLTEKLALEAARRQAALQEKLAAAEEEKETLAQQGELAKARAEKLANDLKIAQAEAALEIVRLQGDVARIDATHKRAAFADAKPVYLHTPLKDNGILVVSDRRIPLNGLITPETADFVTNRIQFWNNKDRSLPIFIVIDASPGGSVMAGYRILKAMESSEAPVHVVVKSFAASMAAAITTLATESYAYPNALILHHQISSMVMGQLNLTEQREIHEESQRWWTRLATPIANKMGLTTNELVTKMYAHSSSGDWSEFAEQAKDLKWVNHIVTGIDETSVVQDPDSIDSSSKPAKATALVEDIDSNGKPFAWLPHLNPKDVYFVYNPDGYYRTR